MDILVKELTDDFDQIMEVQNFLFEQIKQEFDYGYIPEFHKDIKNLNDFYISPKRTNFFVAIDKKSDKIIATIGLRGYDKDFAEFRDIYSKDTTASIWRLFVDRDYRRCGIASTLFSIAERFARENNYKEIYLHTHKTLHGAIDFWKKMGFKVTVDTNNELHTVHMDKNISALRIDGNLNLSIAQNNHKEYFILI